MSPFLAPQGDSSKQIALFTGLATEEHTTLSKDTTAGSNSPPLFRFDVPETDDRVRARRILKPLIFKPVLRPKSSDHNPILTTELGNVDKTVSGSSSLSVSRSRSPTETDSSEAPDPEEVILDKSGRSAFGTPNPIGALVPTSRGVCQSTDSSWK